jgi:hypothetical protein
MKQSEAMRLANELDAYHTAPHHKQAAAELRRLSEALAAPVQPAAWESEMRSELAKLGFEGQCPESIGITIKRWFDAYAESLTAQPAQDLHFFKQVLSVAIAGLYEHYEEDVLNTFSIDELSEVVDVSKSLQSRKVEDIYKQMWDMLSTPPAAQRQWVGLIQQERKDIWREAIGWGDPSHDDIGLMIAIEAKLKEKNT